MTTYLNDMFFVIDETLELIRNESERANADTQNETARDLEEVNEELNRIYGRLWRASISAEEADFIQGRDDQEEKTDGC